MTRSGAALILLALLAGCTTDSSRDAGPAAEPTSTASPAVTTSPDPGDPAGVPLAHRAAHTMTALADGSLLVAGGCVVDGCTTATGSTYLVDRSGAAAVRDLRDARDAHTATLLTDGRVLVVGGFAGEGQPPLTSAEVFDPAAGTWERVGELAVGRGGHAAALLGDGRVVVAGGWVGSGRYTASIEIFDPRTGRFSAGPDLPEAVDGLAAVSLRDGSVLVAGGQSTPGKASAQAVLLLRDGTLRPVTSLVRARFKHAMVTLRTGEVLVVGGTPDDDRLLRSTELFDPVTATFVPGPTLRAGRYKLTDAAVLLPDGRVAVAGGGPGVEVVDVPGATSRFVPAAGRGRASFSTVGISGSRLLVLGGYDESIRLTDTDLAVPLSDL